MSFASYPKNDQGSSLFKRLFVIYLIGFFPILLNFNGVYWDDWTLVGQKPFAWTSQFFENGGWPITIPFHWLYLELYPSVYFCHILIFLLPLAIAFFLNRSLSTVFPNQEGFFFIYTIFFLSFPILQSRITMICFPYLIALLSFTLGFFFCQKAKDSKRKAYHYLSLLFFAYSFVVKSFIIFYAAPLIIIAYQEDIKKDLPQFLKQNWSYLLLPIATYPLLHFIAPVKGVYQNYNSINLSQSELIKDSFILNIESLLAPLKLHLSKVDYIGILLYYPITYLCLRKPLLNLNSPNLSRHFFLKLAILSILLLFLGALPYALVQKHAVLNFVTTRHQLLMLFVVPLILLTFLSLLSSVKKIQLHLIVLLVSLFTFTNTKTYLSFIKLWFFNESIVLNMQASPEIKNNHAFIVTEPVESIFPVFKSGHSFYEYAGFSRKAFQEENRYFAPQSSLNNKTLKNGAFKLSKAVLVRPQYNFTNFKTESFSYLLSIYKNKSLSYKELISLLFLYYTNPLSWKEKIKELRKIRTIKLNKPVKIKII